MTSRYNNDNRVNLCCDRIDDKDLFKAVIFAVTMIRRGTTPNIANARAAKYYKRRTVDVAYYVGQHAARIGSSKRGRARAFEEET